MGIDKKIEAMRERLERSMSTCLTVTFSDGREIFTDSGGAIDLVMNANDGEIVSVTGGGPGCGLLPKLLDGLLHPVPNRRIEDYE